jgi:Domain of Unknown Function (DUF1259)
MKKYLSAIFLVGACTSSPSSDITAASSGSASLPVQKIQDIVGADGHVDNGVLDISIERKDIGDVQAPRGVTFTPAFEVHADLYFQPLSNGKALLNGDFALKEDEVNPFIKALIDNGLVWQAFHQHTPSNPQVWFVHYRGVCDPVALATAIRKAIDTTSTPLPQHSPQNPTTPLDPQKLASILHGTAQVGEEGVVTVSVPRKHGVKLDGVTAEPETGISPTIEFKPTSGTNADVVPDFGMTSDETMPVVTTMLIDKDWYQGCLYNQETAEEPQLYFDHMVKSGDAYQLAAEIRSGLNLTAHE